MFVKYLFVRPAVLGAMLCLAACGGGGGGGGGNNGPPTFSVGGSISGLIGAVTLQNNGSGNLTRLANGSFTFGNFSSGSTYNVTIATQPINPPGRCNLVNGSGTIDSLDVANILVTCHFPSDTALTIESDADDGVSESARVVSTVSGDAIAIWLQSDGSRDVIYMNRHVTGSGWGAAELIPIDDIGSARFPEIAVDVDGNILVVWHQNDTLRDNVWANYYTGGVWGTPVLISTTNIGNAQYPRIAFSANGTATVAWHQSNAASRFSIVAIRFSAGVWGAPVPIENDDAFDAIEPRVAMDPNGNALVVWTQSIGAANIHSNYYSVVDDAWGADAVPMVSTTEYPQRPKVGMDSSGNAMAVWIQFDGTNFNMWANRFVPASGWGTAENIDSVATDTLSPDLAVNANGDAFVVWQQSNFGIWVNRYVVGTGWGLAGRLDAGGTYVGRPRVAVDASGNAIVVHEKFGSGNIDIWARRYTVGSAWGTSIMIENDDNGEARFPHVALSPAGDTTIVWEQSDGTNLNIWGNRLDGF